MALSKQLTEYLPLWSESPGRGGESEDPLGFQRQSEYWANKFLPGLTVLTITPRYYSFICWCTDIITREFADSNQYRGEITWQEFQESFNRFERLLADIRSGVSLG